MAVAVFLLPPLLVVVLARTAPLGYRVLRDFGTVVSRGILAGFGNSCEGVNIYAIID